MENKTIVIIDDEENFCTLVKKNIENATEYAVATATGGQEGLELVKKLKPDLVLLDIGMPDMDGADVAAEILKDKNIQDTPIVFLTALATGRDSDPQLSFTKGYAILSKTATIKELLACIEENIRRYTQP